MEPRRNRKGGAPKISILSVDRHFWLQKGHPREDNLLPEGNGVVYLSLARDYDEQWVLVIDDLKKEERNLILIHKRYKDLLTRYEIDFEITSRNASHLIIDFLDIIPALTLINRDDPL